jgi:RNA polymerase sigma factor (sigma-70 family)
MGTGQFSNDFLCTTYRVLLASLSHRARDQATAEDIVQTTYALVLGHPDFDPGRPGAVGFLKRKALWLLQDHQRRAARAPGPLPDHMADQRDTSPEQALEREETREHLWRLVGHLSRAHHAVMVRHLRGMAHCQIAADLRLPTKTVYRLFHQAKAALRRLIVEGRSRRGGA